MLSFAERLFQTESNWIIKRVYGNDKMKVKVIQCWICSLQMKNYLFTSPKSIRSVNRYVPYTRFSRRNSIEKVLIVHPYKFCPSKNLPAPPFWRHPILTLGFTQVSRSERTKEAQAAWGITVRASCLNVFSTHFDWWQPWSKWPTWVCLNGWSQ